MEIPFPASDFYATVLQQWSQICVSDTDQQIQTANVVESNDWATS